MSRLRNRMVKAEFWTDPELLRWPLAKRLFYQGLWAVAEDSGCLEDDPFGWKLQLFPSPMDADITIDVLAVWRGELIHDGKVIPYAADGKSYLYIRTFHQHEHPRNPQRPDLPLPEWLHHDAEAVKRGDGTFQRNAYSVSKDSVELPNGNGKVTLPSPPPRLAPSRVPKGTRDRGGPADASAVRPAPSSTEPDRICWRCSQPITGDDILDDKCVSSHRGIRHKDCKETP